MKYLENSFYMSDPIRYEIFRNHPEVDCRSRWTLAQGESARSPGSSGYPENQFIEGQPAVLAGQIHSADVKYVDSPGFADQCDGLLTGTTNLDLVIRTADCAAVMIYEKSACVICNLHAGWRGVYARIIEKAIDRMKKDFGCRSENILVAVGPAVGSCCYEVGPEFRELFDKVFLLEKKSGLYFDLKKAIHRQLMNAGVSSENTELSPHCTRCSPLKLPSYRRDRTKNRIWNMIKIKGK